MYSNFTESQEFEVSNSQFGAQTVDAQANRRGAATRARDSQWHVQ